MPIVLDQLRSAGPLVPPSCAVSPLTLYAPEMRASPQGLQCWRLTPTNSLAYVASMAATLIFRDRVVFGDRDFAEFVIWQVPTPVPPTRHGFKYRLVYVVNGLRVIGFDNERGKGDHQHTEGQERPYTFRGVDQLMMDFVGSIEAWRKSHGKS